MSEELLQRDLIKHPDRIDNWLFYNIGAKLIDFAIQRYEVQYLWVLKN